MKRWMICAMTFALALGYLGAADDEKKPDAPKPAKTPEPKAPDWSAYADHSEIKGVVFKADETTVTLRVELPGTRANGMKKTTVDTDYKYADQALARSQKVPQLFDDKGNKRDPKPAELDKLQKPIGVPGYAMERTDLKEGDIVTLKMVRPIAISKTKAKPEDLLIKYAIKTGEKAMPKPKQ